MREFSVIIAASMMRQLQFVNRELNITAAGQADEEGIK
jgi:hypothetical protein